jgi:hypothetical protein
MLVYTNAERLGEFNFDHAHLSGISEMQTFFNEAEITKHLKRGLSPNNEINSRLIF